EVIFGDPLADDAGLSLSPPAAGPAAGRTPDPPAVTVSGWQVYDNKGRVVEQYEPFRSSGWGYAPPGGAQNKEKFTLFYDALGRVVRTVAPDGSESRSVQGVPGRVGAPDLSRPNDFEPTPWEAYVYDANDNAGRTHPDASASYRSHWDTPSSVEVDA